MAEPLTLLTNDIVKDITKNLRPADLARLGMVDTRLRDISTVQMAEILASPTLTNVAQRWRSKLMRPLIHFSTAADLPPEGAGPRKGTGVVSPSNLRAHQVTLQTCLHWR